VLKDLGEDGTPDPQEEGGRGLCLIAALSTRWAWYLTEKPTGKVVWCELSAEPPELSESARSAPQALLSRSGTDSSASLGRLHHRTRQHRFPGQTEYSLR
jgi:hypothetical protein